MNILPYLLVNLQLIKRGSNNYEIRHCEGGTTEAISLIFRLLHYVRNDVL